MSVRYDAHDETAIDVAATIAAGIAEVVMPYHEPFTFRYQGTVVTYELGAPSAATIVRDWFLTRYDFSGDEEPGVIDGDE